MSKSIAKKQREPSPEPDMVLIEQVLIAGDLSRLDPEQRVTYYKQVCDVLGLNPTTKPFDYIVLNGKLVLYANKGCAEQLRQIYKISIRITSRDTVEGVYVVTAQAEGRGGRVDESTGAVTIGGLKGEYLANAMMKAETKAKRRVTLSICGLNMLDELEVQSIPPEDARPPREVGSAEPPAPPASNVPPRRDRKQLGDEIRKIASKMKLEKSDVDEWVMDTYHKPTSDLTNDQMEEFLGKLQAEAAVGAAV